jgi:hypothetical protein
MVIAGGFPERETIQDHHATYNLSSTFPLSLPYTHSHIYSYIPTMSERTPLLSGSVNGQSLPSRREVQSTIQNNIPSKAQRIQVAQAKGALAAGKLP